MSGPKRVHGCAAGGCKRLVAVYLLMCVDHWRMVPAALKRDVLASAKAMTAERSLAAVKAYREVVAAAVAAVAEKQTKKMNNVVAVFGDLFAPAPAALSNHGAQALTKEEHGDNFNDGAEPDSGSSEKTECGG